MDKTYFCAQDVALSRYDIISPLLEEGLEKAEYSKRRSQIIASGKTSDRTLCRYLKNYREQGFDGLLPQSRSDEGSVRAVPAHVISEALNLKSELPQRSADSIIFILQKEGVVKTGKLSPSTLRRHLRQHHLESPGTTPTKGIRRFEREHRNRLWQVDCKHGPWLKDPQTGKNTRTQLLAFIDDATRVIPFARFYFNARLPILEDGFRQAVLCRGLPDQIYVDNGKIFISKWFKTACAKLSVQHTAAKPYSPSSKGKIERFMQTVEAFLAEMSIVKPKSIEELNQALHLWVTECYHQRPHEGLDGHYPEAKFQEDKRALRLISLEELKDAFLWEEQRQVDKTGCIKYHGQLYDVGPSLARQKILIRFDPFDDETVEVWLAGKKYGLAKKLVWNQARQELLPESEQLPVQIAANAELANPSRLMICLEKQEKERNQRKYGAISYRDIPNGEEPRRV